MARYKPASEKIQEYLALKARAQAIVAQMNTKQLKKFLTGRKTVQPTNCVVPDDGIKKEK
jgi:hypothetical protein